jgi:Zn-dependent metalloprotease
MSTRATHTGKKAFAPCCIVPPHILKQAAESGDPDLRKRALRALELSAAVRGHRLGRGRLLGDVRAAEPRRSVYDGRHGTRLPGVFVRDERGPASDDTSVEQAFDGADRTWRFYRTLFGRNSIDGRGAEIESTVHYATRFDNAFWNGRQMVYGDGDGVLFNDFTACLDVIGHELTHGVTSNEADLEYRGQPGALNESMSDVFGILVKQWALSDAEPRQAEARTASWIIGEGLLGRDIKGRGLRSLAAPGTAYDDPRLGKDPQPAHMDDYQDLPPDEDNGGVHINSGIPNHAFYLAAVDIGGPAWERAGAIWYEALTKYLRHDGDFQAAADATSTAAMVRYGPGSAERRAVEKAWAAVGVPVRTPVLT